MSQNNLHEPPEHSFNSNPVGNDANPGTHPSRISIHTTPAPNWKYIRWNCPDGKDPFELCHQALLEQEAKRCTAWKEEVQNLLILAGLFSAIVTAFIIESYQTLQPDPNDQIISLLSRIADQMSVPIANTSSHTPSLPTSSGFIPTPTSVRVNIFWFVSLVLSLTVALIGIITLQWLREYQLYETGTEPIKAFAILNARSDGLKRWYVPQIFAGLPLLLQAALVLFLVGLVEFLFAVHIEVAILVSAAVAIPIIFLIATTVTPTLQLYAMHLPYFLRVNDHAPAPCPYKSPQALIFQRAALISTTLFSLSSSIFSALWTPFAVVVRLFVTSDKPFYGKSAPLGTVNYLESVNRLRKATSNWMVMDREWLAVRTSYAVAFHTPNSCRHFKWPYNAEFGIVGAYYDCIKGIINMMHLIDYSDRGRAWALNCCSIKMFNHLRVIWDSGASFDACSNDPERGKALQIHFTALRRIIGPSRHPLTENLVELAQEFGGAACVARGLSLALWDQAVGPEIDFETRGAPYLIIKHMHIVHFYLSRNAHDLFLCSNRPGITPLASLSKHYSLPHHRDLLVRHNPAWMRHLSSFWTQCLKSILLDIKMPPRQPFTFKCAGSPTAKCGSNLHTESTIELTEYILLFQVPTEIRATLRLLHNLLKSKPSPVHDLPFVLIIACAYINAVANVNLDDVAEFRTVLFKICDLCGSLDPTLKVRPGGTGWHWPKMEFAFDYIRNNCLPGNEQSTSASSQSPNPLSNAGADDNV